MKKTILCELSFWESFSKQYPSIHIEPGQLESMWIEYYSFLSRSDIYWDCTYAEFYEKAKSDTPLMKLWKKYTQGECGMEFEIFKPTSVSEALRRYPYCTLFSEKRSDKAKKFGILNITTDNYSQMPNLFVDNGVALRHGENWDWSKLKKYLSQPSNSMILVDNYAFQYEKENLYRILELILPDKLSFQYHLLIFHQNGKGQNINNLENTIKQLKPNLDIVIEDIQTGQDPTDGYRTDFHDRAIITNNIWIGSGAGFNLIKWNRKEGYLNPQKSTTLTVVFPGFSSRYIKWIDGAYQNLIEDAKSCLSRKGVKPVNRLLHSDELSPSTQNQSGPDSRG